MVKKISVVLTHKGSPDRLVKMFSLQFLTIFVTQTYRGPKKLVRLSEVTDGGLGMLSFPKDGCVL